MTYYHEGWRSYFIGLLGLAATLMGTARFTQTHHCLVSGLCETLHQSSTPRWVFGLYVLWYMAMLPFAFHTLLGFALPPQDILEDLQALFFAKHLVPPHEPIIIVQCCAFIMTVVVCLGMLVLEALYLPVYCIAAAFSFILVWTCHLGAGSRAGALAASLAASLMVTVEEYNPENLLPKAPSKSLDKEIRSGHSWVAFSKMRLFEPPKRAWKGRLEAGGGGLDPSRMSSEGYSVNLRIHDKLNTAAVRRSSPSGRPSKDEGRLGAVSRPSSQNWKHLPGASMRDYKRDDSLQLSDSMLSESFATLAPRPDVQPQASLQPLYPPSPQISSESAAGYDAPWSEECMRDMSDFGLILFRVVTRGTKPQMVADVCRRNILLALSVYGDAVPWRFEVVTDEPLDLKTRLVRLPRSRHRDLYPYSSRPRSINLREEEPLSEGVCSDAEGSDEDGKYSGGRAGAEGDMIEPFLDPEAVDAVSSPLVMNPNREAASGSTHSQSAIKGMGTWVGREEDTGASPLLLWERVCEIVVPETYRTPNGTQYKARALHYANRREVHAGFRSTAHISSSTSLPYCVMPNDIIVHLDEESLLHESCLEGLLDFLEDDWNRIGMGTIVYGHGPVINYFTTMGDSVRVCEDVCKYRLHFNFAKPVLGMKGSFVVMPLWMEEAIGWDFGPYGSIAEDAAFALHASQWTNPHPPRTSSLPRRMGFGFVKGVVHEQSPFDLVDYFKQRRRWFNGLWLVVRHPKLKWHTVVSLYVMQVIWTLAPFWTLIAIVACLTAPPPKIWPLAALQVVATGCWYWTYLYGCILNFAASGSACQQQGSRTSCAARTPRGNSQSWHSSSPPNNSRKSSSWLPEKQRLARERRARKKRQKRLLLRNAKIDFIMQFVQRRVATLLFTAVATPLWGVVESAAIIYSLLWPSDGFEIIKKGNERGVRA